MKIQWTLIFALIFALLMALFAVVNVEAVQVNYMFGTAQLPLIIVIVGSTLLGGLIVGLFGIIRQYRLQKQIKTLNKKIQEYENQAAAIPTETPKEVQQAQQAEAPE